MLVPPEVLVGPTVVLRRSVVDDAALLSAAARASVEHLAPWMGWATPEGTSIRTQQVRLAAQTWAPGEEWGYLIRDPADDAVIGGCGLMHRRGPGTLEIGYWVHVDHTGRGVATEAARLLTGAAERIDGVGRVVDPHRRGERPQLGRPPAAGLRPRPRRRHGDRGAGRHGPHPVVAPRRAAGLTAACGTGRRRAGVQSTDASATSAIVRGVTASRLCPRRRSCGRTAGSAGITGAVPERDDGCEVRPATADELDAVLPLVAEDQRFSGVEPDDARDRAFFVPSLLPSDD